jgi:hypothetical protein
VLPRVLPQISYASGDQPAAMLTTSPRRFQTMPWWNFQNVRLDANSNTRVNIDEKIRIWAFSHL